MDVDDLNSGLEEFLTRAKTSLKKHGWTDTSYPNSDMVLKKEIQTSIVRTFHSLFFINASHLKKEDFTKIITDIHQHAVSQPPLVPVVNTIIFIFDCPLPFDVSNFLSNGKKQEITTSISTICWIVDLQNKTLFTHPGPPFVKKGKKEIETILQQL